MSSPTGLGRELGQIAEIAAKIAENADPNQEYCSSFFLPLPAALFERETIETLEVCWGTRRTTIGGELLRVDFDVNDCSQAALYVRHILRSFVVPLVEGFGGVVQDTPEGFVILGGNYGAIEDRHSSVPMLMLIGDDAIERMADRLLTEISLETDSIMIADREEAQRLVIALIRVAV